MPKKKDETFSEYRSRIIDVISPSYCAAKWYNATIWLAAGKTTSCHSPIAHNISPSEITTNPSALHNTFKKKTERKMMLKGHRPKGCESCWILEDIADNKIISDRVFKTAVYSDDDIQLSHNEQNPLNDFNPRNLEIAFDSVCNLACSYCNSSFSSSWLKDINNKGYYLNLLHPDQSKINHKGHEFHGSHTDPKSNVFIQAFWTWWPNLIKDLQEFRITGGEPLLSKQFWKVLEKFKDPKINHIKLAINSNLSVSEKLINQLIEQITHINHLDIYTSCEARGKHAEYIRDGLDYNYFINNCRKLITESNIKSLNMMMTINVLSLFSITEFLDELVALKKEFGIQFPVWTINLIHYPAFMNPLILPKKIRLSISIKLKKWLKLNKDKEYITDMELEGVYRLIKFLQVGKISANETDEELRILQHDFHSFYKQYDQRRNKSLRDTFPQELVHWYDSIEVV